MSKREKHFFVISVAAERAGMHAQTLRQYDRLGLVTPARAQGGGRRYSDEEQVEQLEETLEAVNQQHRTGSVLVHVPRSQAVVVWSPEARRRS